ncbi:hypothetical protein AX16_001581 [Volvariella volvacea WC 439]|nr:hypothetical protein AX16_001581 [Volvariella volvacea WC 439]
MATPPVINIHTPTSSFAIVHSLNQEDLRILYNKLTRKINVEQPATPTARSSRALSYSYKTVGPGWLKYEFNGSIWNLDDESDYSIFAWRCEQQRQNQNQNQHPQHLHDYDHELPPPLATSSNIDTTPTLHLHDPSSSLPSTSGSGYINPAFYLAKYHHPTPKEKRKSKAHGNGLDAHGAGVGGTSHSEAGLDHGIAMSVISEPISGLGRGLGRRGRASVAGGEEPGQKQSHLKGSKDVKGKVGKGKKQEEEPAYKKAFEKFHAENGVRTVIGSIGSVNNVRMLLKSSHRHVYISRKFATKYGFIPSDAQPGYYGYEGLVSIGTWPITVQSVPEDPDLTKERKEGYFQSLRNMTGSPALTSATGAETTRSYTPSLYKPQVGSQAGPQLYLPIHPQSRPQSQLQLNLQNPSTLSLGSHLHPMATGTAAQAPLTTSDSVSVAMSKAKRRKSLRGKSPLASASILQPQLTGTDMESGIRRVSSVSSASVSTRSSLYSHSHSRAHPNPHYYVESEDGMPTTPRAPHHPQDSPTPSDHTSSLTPTHHHPVSYHTPPSHPSSPAPSHSHPPPPKPKPTVTMCTVYLSEEPHFDVVLGRAFWDKRQIKTNNADPTDVVCLDTGERLECELVVLKDGKGEIVTVT